MRRAPLGLCAALALVSACAGNGAAGDAAAMETGSDASASEAGAGDAGAGDAGGSSITATFAANTRGFDRGQFGFEAVDMMAGRGVHIEMYAGGDPACPTMTSRTPDRTLVLSGVRVPAARTPLTEADGLVLSLLDFQGDLSMSPAPVRATAVRVTVREASIGDAANARLVLDVEGDFPGGAAVRGSVTATHCNSLD